MAYIDASPDPLFTGSHELAEMLGDPMGNNTYTAPSPDPADKGKEVEILDELCDPCEDNSFAIEVDGVSLSDFITSKFGNGTSGPYDAAEKLTKQSLLVGRRADPEVLGGARARASGGAKPSGVVSF